MNWKSNIIKILLAAVIVILGYLVVDSILKPVRFEKAVDQRSKAVVQNLIDLRNSQQFYKQFNNKYMGNFDTLINFLQTSEIAIVKKIPDPTDTTFTKTINDTLGYVKVADSIFQNRKDFSLNSLRYIPYTDNKVFEINADFIARGGMNVPVFEIKAHYKTFLKGLDEQLIINLVKARKDYERYPGLKVGSLEEPSTDGNWE